MKGIEYIMSVYVTGDTHGEYGRLLQFDMLLKPGDFIIVCGDFGYIFKNDANERRLLDDIETKEWNLLFVDGNHENFDALYSYPEEEWHGGKIHRIAKNIIHLCRGQVFEIENKHFFTFGGGYSLDKIYRKERVSWWPQEMPSDKEFVEANKNLKRVGMQVDYIVTHTAPESVIAMMGHKSSEESALNNYLEYIRECVKYDHWYMGHLHKDTDVTDKLSILWFEIRKII